MPSYLSSIKCVLVGNCGVGKTCLLIAYTTGIVGPRHYVPKIFDGWAKTITVRGGTYSFGLWDTGEGTLDHDRLRPLSYIGASVFLVCFAVDSSKSFESVRRAWISEISHHSHGIPFILVGTKIELRSDDYEKTSSKRKFVTKEEGEEAAREIGAVAYLECSAFTREGVDDVFKTAMFVGSDPIYEKKSRKCCIF
ncbi:cell division control protein 42 [Ramaria rubella]|nr:cell division control protein 42 [Ramaria rubella]